VLQAAQTVILCPSSLFRRLTVVFVAAGASIGLLYTIMGVLGHGVGFLISAVIVLVVLAGRPIAALRGRTVLLPDGIAVRREPGEWLTVPAAQVALVEIRRGLVAEWPVLHMWNGPPIELGAPARLWMLPDPEYARDLNLLRIHAGRPGPALPVRHQWSGLRLLAGPLLAATAVVLILLDPPWKSDQWPLRQHAGRLPDACQEFDAHAHRLLPGAQVDGLFSRNDDSDELVKRHTCQWNATHLDPGGRRLVDVGRLSVELELDHGIGPVSDADQAHQTFLRAVQAEGSGTVKRVARIGDEADLVMADKGAFATVSVTVRRANVEEKIDIILAGAGREREAAADVTALARLGLARIPFS
jgi:hypothetical protein